MLLFDMTNVTLEADDCAIRRHIQEMTPNKTLHEETRETKTQMTYA